MNKVFGIFGAISGVLNSALLYFYYTKELYTFREYNLLYRSFTLLALAICVVFAIIAVKKMNGGIISFMRSMFTGFMVSLISGLVSFGFFTTLYFGNHDLLVKPEKVATEQFIKTVTEAKDSTVNMKEALANLHNQFTPGGFLLPNMFSSFVFGMITAIFVTAFVFTRTEQTL